MISYLLISITAPQRNSQDTLSGERFTQPLDAARNLINHASLSFFPQGVASLGISADVGPGNPMLIKRDGKGTVQLKPLLAGQEPPLSFGRVSASDTVQLLDGRRRMYTAIGYAFNTPDFFGVRVGRGKGLGRDP